MSSRLFCSPVERVPASRTSITKKPHFFWIVLCLGLGMMGWSPRAAAGDAPQWMHSLVNAPLPAHDEKTDAVLMYSEESVNVVSADKIKRTVRQAYKILRPQGREHGDVFVYLDSNTKITSLHGWCIPSQGKDFEVKDKDAMEMAPPMIRGAELVEDLKVKVIRIPASDPGNIIGYEYETEEHPLVLQDAWYFQHRDPVREAQFSLTLPTGWEYKVAWLNYSQVEPAQSASGYSRWVVRDIKGLRPENDMPPYAGVAGQMIVTFFPPGGPSLNGFANWKEMGDWYRNLISSRLDPSSDIKQKVASLTANIPSSLDKMRALALFVQHDIRYVAIELGIGGWQPHPAGIVFTHRYGDCKDKATLMRSMLHEIGIETYHVAINTERGSITPATPAHRGFNHQMIAIKVPAGMNDPTLVAVLNHPSLGRILFFDPTDELTPLGQIRGELQANYGLLVTPGGGELVELPKEPPDMNSIRRYAKLSLDLTGKLQGDVQETRVGDRAQDQRGALRTATRETERIKPIENILAGSLANFRITNASVINLQQSDQPFGFNYTFVSENYAQNAGNLLLVRPRVLGSKARGFLETKEPRQFPIEFEGPVRDEDKFEITLPPGYEVDELPPPVDVDFGFASYHSKTEAKGNVIGYTRTFEIKELSVPVSKAEELKKFYRIIASDERNTAVLKPAK